MSFWAVIAAFGAGCVAGPVALLLIGAMLGMRALKDRAKW